MDSRAAVQHIGPSLTSYFELSAGSATHSDGSANATLWASYTGGRDGAGLCGGAAAGVSVDEEATVGWLGVGWKLGGIGEQDDRRSSLGPAGEWGPPVLDSTLTFCRDNTGEAEPLSMFRGQQMFEGGLLWHAPCWRFIPVPWSHSHLRCWPAGCQTVHQSWAGQLLREGEGSWIDPTQSSETGAWEEAVTEASLSARRQQTKAQNKQVPAAFGSARNNDTPMKPTTLVTE